MVIRNLRGEDSGQLEVTLEQYFSEIKKFMANPEHRELGKALIRQSYQQSCSFGIELMLSVDREVYDSSRSVWENWRSKGYLALANHYNSQKAVYEKMAREIGADLKVYPDLPLNYKEGIALLSTLRQSL